MTCSHVPPTRKSIFLIVVLKPRGPHQFVTCCGSVHACHTSSRGAWRTRVMTISRSEALSTDVFMGGVGEIKRVLPDSTNGRAPGRQVSRQAVKILLIGRENEWPDLLALGRVIEDHPPCELGLVAPRDEGHHQRKIVGRLEMAQ